jgi:lysophospholipase L1-like esterase
MRSLLANIALALGALFVALLGFELALRFAGYNPFGRMLDGHESIVRESVSPGLIYELTPNARRTVWGVDFRVNSAGMRDREYAVAKLDGVYRIVVLGDSITAGHRLPIEAAFPDRLEELFGKRGMKVEVLNLGVDGYDIAHEVAALEHKGLQFDPDEVILAYCMNDIGHQSGSLGYIAQIRKYGVPYFDLRTLQFVTFQLKRIFGGEPLPKMAMPRAEQGIADDSFITERTGRIKDYVASSAYLRDTWGTLEWYGEPNRIGGLRAAFARLKEMSTAHGFKVTVLILPYLTVAAPVHGDAYGIVRREAELAGFGVVEPLQAFEAEGLASVRFGPGDPVHPNAKGHAIIAQQLFEAHRQQDP